MPPVSSELDPEVSASIVEAAFADHPSESDNEEGHFASQSIEDVPEGRYELPDDDDVEERLDLDVNNDEDVDLFFR